MPKFEEIINNLANNPKALKQEVAEMPSYTPQQLRDVSENSAVSADIQNTQMNKYRMGIANRYLESLASPDEIKDLRSQAIQAINRGATANATPGTTGGFNAAEWRNLQGILGGGNKPVGSMGTYGGPAFDFSNQIASADQNTKYNQDYANSELDKVNPDLMKVLANEELGYGNDVFNRNPQASQAVIDQQIKQSEADKIAADANLVKQQGDILAGQPITPQSSNKAFGKNISQGGFYNPEAYNQELLQQYPDNKEMLNQAAVAYGNPDPTQAKQVAEDNSKLVNALAPQLNQSNFNSPAAVAQFSKRAIDNVDLLKGDNWSANLQNVGKGIDPADYVSDNLWQVANKKLGGGGGKLDALFATMNTLQPMLSPEQRQQAAQAILGNKVVDANSLKDIIGKFTTQANSNYKAAALTNNIIQKDPGFISGARRGQNLQSAITQSAFISQPPVNGHDFQSWWLNKHITPEYKQYFEEHPQVYGPAMLDLIQKGSTDEAYNEFKTWADKAPKGDKGSRNSILGTSLYTPPSDKYIPNKVKGKAMQTIQPRQNMPEATPAPNPSPDFNQLVTGNI